MSSLLRVDNVSIKTVQGQLLVDSVSFELIQGELVVLLGQSGSGKTMTSLAIMDLLPSGVELSSGDITIKGNARADRVRGRDIGIIMQSPSSCFDQVFSMKTQFIDILKSHGKQHLCSDEQLEKIVTSVGLSNPAEILKAYPFQLSGGMLQRLMIGVTLALDVSIIIADEPSSDLDLPAQSDIIDMFLRIDRSDKAFIVITHDISVAKRMADRVIVMQYGKIVDNFKIDELNSDSRHPYTKELITANNSLRENKWGYKVGNEND